MGFLAKARTQSRTAPLSVTSGFDPALGDIERWHMIDAVVRAASATVGSQRRVSSTQRGRTTSLANAVSTLRSELVFVHHSNIDWQLTLGADSSAGFYRDWLVCAQSVRSTSTGVQGVDLSTKEALTTNGELANGAGHDELRSLIAHGVSSGSFPSQSATTAVSEQGFETVAGDLLDAVPQEFSEDFQISSDLDADGLRARICMMTAISTHPQDDRWHFDLGPAGSESASVQLRLEADVVLRGRVRFTRSGRVIRDAVAYQLARSFGSQLLGTVRLSGTKATLTVLDSAAERTSE